MKTGRPLGILLIGGFYLFGAAVLLLTLGVRQDVPMNLRFGVPGFPETAVRIVVALFSVVLAFGYLRQARWGFRAMMVYSILFLAISLYQSASVGGQPYWGNAVFSLIVLIYTFCKRDCFYRRPLPIYS